MSEPTTNRRLAAILAADVVGYSKLMSADEHGTLVALKAHREQVFEPAVTRHNGRTFKLMGDGTLVEFASVVDAVKCALDIQKLIAEQPKNGAPKIVLRIGVNLGDVIIDGDDVYGDGVNVAARLEPLAPHGGICVSSIVNESVSGRIDVALQDAGVVEVKNIDRPIRIWKWSPGDGNGAAAPPAAAPTSAPEQADVGTAASIAVLPFDNMSGDPEQEYFSDGISEDIITDLSKIAGLLVIARNSSFAYKGRSIDLRTVGRELGVSNVLEGSIRRAGNRVRITAQLIEAQNGGHLWADRYDRDLTDIFEVQDEVTRQIVGALKIALTPQEEGRLVATTTTNPEAHDNYLRARELLHASVAAREGYLKVQSLLDRALELDPDYADAHAARAMALGFDHLNRWSDDPDSSLEKARAGAAHAVELAPDEPYGHYVRSVTLGLSGDAEAARAETERALELNPNFAPAHNSRGALMMLSGNPRDAIPSVEKAIRLDPGSGQQYLHFLGLAHLLLGNFETAAATFRERILQFPQTDLSRSFLAATLGHLGEIDEARRIWSELQDINPDYTIDRHLGNLNFQREEDTALIREGLAKAGLPRQ